MGGGFADAGSIPAASTNLIPYNTPVKFQKPA